MGNEVRVYPAECICGEFFVLRIPEMYNRMTLEEAIYFMMYFNDVRVYCKKCNTK